MKVNVTRLKGKVVHQSQGHSSRSRSQLKVKITVLKVTVMDEGQCREIVGQKRHTSRSINLRLLVKVTRLTSKVIHQSQGQGHS